MLKTEDLITYGLLGAGALVGIYFLTSKKVPVLSSTAPAVTTGGMVTPGTSSTLISTFMPDRISPKPIQLGPDADRSSYPACAPGEVNFTVLPCPPGTHRACTRMAKKCPIGQTLYPLWQCGPCKRS